MKRADDDAMTAPGIAGGQPFSNTMVATMPKSIGPHTRRQRIALRLSATAADSAEHGAQRAVTAAVKDTWLNAITGCCPNEMYFNACMYVG